MPLSSDTIVIKVKQVICLIALNLRKDVVAVRRIINLFEITGYSGTARCLISPPC